MKTTMKKIIYTRPDDQGVSVVYPVAKENLEASLSRSLTDQEYHDHVWERSVPQDAINARLIEDNELPKEDEFRDAWKDLGTKIDYDYRKAREIALKKLRLKRDELLCVYDKQINIKEDEKDKQAVEQLQFKRQQLRNATDALKNLNSNSIQDIKDATPSLEAYEDPYNNQDSPVLAQRQEKPAVNQPQQTSRRVR